MAPPPWEHELGRRLRDHLEAGTTDLGPDWAELPVEAYTDVGRHRRELAAMADQPAVVCFASEVAAPGSYRAVRLGELPLLVTRDPDGSLHGLLNVCRHRGSPLVDEGSGSVRALTCPFHAWSYDLDGRLRHVPEAATVGPVCVEARSLVPVEVEERHGMVWLTGRPGGAATTVERWLGPELDAQLGDLGLDRFVLHRQERFDLACNWKLVTDGFLETYHLRYLHRRTIAPYFESNTVVMQAWGDHQRAALPKTRLRRQFEAEPDAWDVLAHTTLAYVLFPTTVLQWQAGHLEAFSIRPHPDDPARCRVVLGLLVPSERAGEGDRWDRNWRRVVETIPAEDFAQAERAQAGFASGANRTLLLGRTEAGLQRFWASVERRVEAGTGGVAGAQDGGGDR